MLMSDSTLLAASQLDRRVEIVE